MKRRHRLDRDNRKGKWGKPLDEDLLFPRIRFCPTCGKSVRGRTVWYSEDGRMLLTDCNCGAHFGASGFWSNVK